MTGARAQRFRQGGGWRTWIAAIAFFALPTVGLFSGGAYAGFVFGAAALLVLGNAIQGQWPSPDWPLAILAALALIFFWSTGLWSIAPRNTMTGSLQMTGIFAGLILFLAQRRSLAAATPTIFRGLLIAAIVGPILVVLDIAAGFPILEIVTGRSPETDELATKLARGITQFALLIWPIAAYAYTSGRRIYGSICVGLLILLMAATLTSATAAALCFAVGAIALLLALATPRLVAAAGAVAIAVAALASPWLVRAMEGWLLPIAAGLKTSATHRLEIWDYMTARITERPLTGWGWQSARALPIHAEELARYRWVGPAGTPHPHDFWLQLWVETGAPGAVLGGAFALLVLWRAWRLPGDIRPFALAAAATGFVSSLASFNLATDAWWCAAAATGLLFALIADARNAAP